MKSDYGGALGTEPVSCEEVVKETPEDHVLCIVQTYVDQRRPDVSP